jgi:hypothetical protein
MYPVAVVLQYTYTIQYNKILYNTQKTQNNTYTLKTIHNTKIKYTITQNYKHNARKITNIKFQRNTWRFNLTSRKEISICTIIPIWSINNLVITVHSTPCSPALFLHCTTLNDTSFPINLTLFHFTFLPFGFYPFSIFYHFFALHITTLHFTTLHFSSFYSTTLQYFTSPLHYTSLYFTTLRYTWLHFYPTGRISPSHSL